MKRHHRVLSQNLEPDPYESDWVPKNKGLVLHQMPCSLGGTWNQTSASITPGNYMTWLTDKEAGDNTGGYWASWTVGVYVIDAFDKFGTIETDEIAWFDRNLTYHVGQNGNGWGYYMSPERLKEFNFFDREDVPNIDEFQHLYGGWYPWGDVNVRATYFPTKCSSDSGYPNDVGFKVYDISEGNVQPEYDTVNSTYRSVYNIINWGDMNNVTGGEASYGSPKRGTWQVPETAMVLQLLGQLPRHNELAGGTRWEDVLDFFLIDKDSDTIGKIPSPVGENWYHANISGLGFVPNGKWQSSYVGQTEPNPDHFGVAACFATFGTYGQVAKTMIAMANSRNTTDIQGGQVTPANFQGMAVASNWLTSGHNAAMRYCRVKTPAEMGYELVIDNVKDRVIFVAPDFDIDAANTDYGVIVPPVEERFKIVAENGTYGWNHSNSLGYVDQSLLRGTKIVQVKVEISQAGTFHLVVTSNNQNDPLNVKRYYPFEVEIGWNILTCDIDLASDEYLILGALNLNLPDNTGTFTDTARQRVVYPTTQSPYGGAVFTRNNEQTVTNVDPNVSITVQPPNMWRYSALPIGMERGVALRYANRQYKKVLRSYSTIKAEAKQLLGTVAIEV